MSTRKHFGSDVSPIRPKPLPAAETLSTDDLARVLGITPALVRRGVREGSLPGTYVGDKVLILRSWVDAFLRGEVGFWDRRTVAQTAEATAERMAADAKTHPFIRRLERAS
jgi:excisionase family DNA binding protein